MRNTRGKVCPDCYPDAPREPGLYFTDNGAVYCLDHLGTAARFTGRDISGQAIQRLTDSDERFLRTFAALRKNLCEACPQ